MYHRKMTNRGHSEASEVVDPAVYGSWRWFINRNLQHLNSLEGKNKILFFLSYYYVKKVTLQLILCEYTVSAHFRVFYVPTCDPC